MPQACIECRARGAKHSISRLLPRQPPEQKCAEHDKQNIRKPDEQFRVRMWIRSQRIANDYEQKIARGNNQAHGEAN